MNREICIILIIAALLFAIALLGLLLRFLLTRLTDRRIEQYQNDLLQKHYDEVETMYRNMRGWRHDYKNHIATMKIHLQNQQYDLLASYLDELDHDLTTVDTVLKTGNVMVDAILNSKLSLAAARGIRTEATAHVPGNLRIADIDLCVILGNLMDNAIEAAGQFESPEDRFIRVYMGLLKGQLYLYVMNSVGGKLKKEEGAYRSTKQGGHGFGLRRIDATVKKYGGYLNRQDEATVFATEITLPI